MISVSFAHDRLSVCVGDVALSLSNKVSYLSQDTLNNKLTTFKYLHINFCFSCQSSIKTGNDLFISIYSHSTITKYKFWGAFHLRKKPGNFGSSKSGISDW